MKKVLFVLPNLKTGGTVSAFNSLYNAIKDREDWDISVFSLSHYKTAYISFENVLLPKDIWIDAYNTNYSEMNGREKLLAYSIKVLKRIGYYIGFDIGNFLYSRRTRKLQNQKFDIVIAFQENEPTFFAKHFDDAYKIAWIHCNYKYRYQNLSYDEIDIYSSFNKIVNVSKFTNEEFVKIYQSLEDKCDYLYNILDYEQIRYKSHLFIPEEFKSNKINIVSIGRISPIKQFHLIPNIAKKLVDRGLDFNWFIIGPTESEGEFNRIKESISELNISCVHLLGGRTNPYPYIENSDLLVCTSESEACPMIFNEAKSLGTPIITTDFGSAYEFIENRVNGFIVPKENFEDNIFSFFIDKKLNEDIKHSVRHFINPNNDILNKFEKEIINNETN